MDEFLFDPNSTLEVEETFIEWDLLLGPSHRLDKSVDIGFDIGVPGLGLQTEGDIDLLLDWELDLGFGLDFEDGFYVKIDDPHELLFDVEVSLPAEVTGQLGFLGLRAANDPVDFDPGPGEDFRSTRLGATFMVDIYEDGASGADAEKLGFTEFGDIGLDVNVAAEAVVGLALELGLSPEVIGEAFGDDAGDVVSGFPTIRSDFLFLWELGMRAGGDAILDVASRAAAIEANSGWFDLSDFTTDIVKEGLKLITFTEISLDLGEFLSDVLGPLVKGVLRFHGSDRSTCRLHLVAHPNHWTTRI